MLDNKKLERDVLKVLNELKQKDAVPKGSSTSYIRQTPKLKPYTKSSENVKKVVVDMPKQPRKIIPLGNCVLYIKDDRTAVVSWHTHYVYSDKVGVVSQQVVYQVTINGIVNKPLEFLKADDAEACAMHHTSDNPYS